MWLLLLFLLAVARALPAPNERVPVCGPDGVSSPMRIVTALEYVRLQPGSCWGPCPCPPSESAACAIAVVGLPNGRMRLIGAFNSTTFVDAALWVDGVHVGGATAEIDSPVEPARVVLRALDARFFECESETVLGPAVTCPQGQFVCSRDDGPVPAQSMGRLSCSDGVPTCASPPPPRKSRGLPPDPTCQSLYYECGEYLTDYGTRLSCGSCPETHKCREGHCIPIPNSIV